MIEATDTVTSETGDTTDVLIVGAGPTGLALAASLAQQGCMARVVDPLAAGANTSRAAVVHARTLEVLESIGATEPLLQRGIRVPTFRVRDRDRTLATIDFTRLPSAYPFTLMCPQNETEAILAERLAAFDGRVERGSKAVALDAHDDGVSVHIETRTGTAMIAARYVVGCDGMHSVVRSAAGIAFDGAAYAQSFVLADVRLDGGGPADTVDLFLSPEGLVVLAPLPGGHHRIVATADDAPEVPGIAFMQQVLDGRGPQDASAPIVDLVWSARFHVHHRVAARMRAGPILLAGDAAHVHSPAGGQGMNTGIQDAVALAPALIDALRTSSGDALDRWAEARHAHARRIVRMTDRMTRAATLRSPSGRQIRNLVLRTLALWPPVTRSIAVQLAELD